jgi:DNA-binding transcriptional LysR family regulator
MDMKLLAVFDEVYTSRSVSRAGEKPGMAQTSVSLEGTGSAAPPGA